MQLNFHGSDGDTERERGILYAMRNAVGLFVAELTNGGHPRWLTFTGEPGCGKTHLARIITDFMQVNGENLYNRHQLPKIDPHRRNYRNVFSYRQELGYFSKWSRLLKTARDGDYWPLERAGLDVYKVVDDLGADSLGNDGQATAFASQKMAELLDARLGKWTVFTTNFSHGDLAGKFDPRIASRLIRDGNVIVDCAGLRDFNLRNK